MIKHRYISRTGLTQFQRCPRLGYLTQIHGGRGVAPIKKASPLLVGIAAHAGVEYLMRDAFSGKMDVEKAVSFAIGKYNQDVGQGVAGIPEKYQYAVQHEHHLIAEAATRLYAAVRIPAILEKYTIIEVEKEHTIRLTPHLTLISRPDAVFENNFSGLLDSFSLKTAGKYDYRKQKDPTVDMQGLSESFAVQHDYPNYTVNGVMMEYIVVGKEDEIEADDGSGDTFPIRRTPLIRGWMRSIDGGGIGPKQYELAWRYKYDNPNYDPLKPRKAGNFKQSSLSPKQGWVPAVASNLSGGVVEWLANLTGWNNETQQHLMIPKHTSATTEIFGYPPPYLRRQDHIDEWLESTIYEQTEVSRRLEALEAGTVSLAKAFPKYSHSCTYPTRCPMYDICWKGALPEDPKLFEPRKPHHEQELDGPPED